MKKNPKQIAAIICIAAIVIVLIAMLSFAIIGKTDLFRACLYAVITLPVLTWVYIFLYGVTKKKHTIASLDIGKEPEEQKKEA